MSLVPMSPNLVMKINEISDKREVGEVDIGRLLRMYRKNG